MYREELLELYKNPLNFGKLKKFSSEAKGENESCGDSIHIQILTNGKIIKDIKFEGIGCVLCLASTSLVTEKLKGRNIEEVKKLGENFVFKTLGFEPLPARVKCTTLGLETIREALWKN